MALNGAILGGPASFKWGGSLRWYDQDESAYAGVKATATITGSVDYTLPAAPPAADGYVLKSTTAGVMTWEAGGSGTVTSVAIAAPSFMTVSGSPITSSGTITLAFANQAPGQVLIGPIAGNPAAAPTFRGLASGDIPALGGNPSATIGLSATNGSATTYLRSDGAPALSQGIAPTWTGSHNFDGGQIFRSTADYDKTPLTQLKGDFKYNAGGSYSTLCYAEMGKENTGDGNTAGYFAIFTRQNGGANAEGFRVTSTKQVKISGAYTLPTSIATNNVFYASSSSAIAAISASNNAIFVTDGSGTPQWATTLPSSLLTSSQVTGAGTEYTLTGSYARVDFGTTDAQVTLSTAGTYLVTAIIGIANNSISAAVHFKFYNSTDSADVSNSERKQNIQAAVANGQIVLQNLITVNGSKTIQIYGTSPTASADVDVIAAETSISFVKLAV